MQYIIFRVAVFNRSKGILLWFTQVRGFYERAAQKLRDEGAFITDKIEQDHDNAVKDIFDNQDLNDDNYISPYEFMRSKKTILYFPEDETIEDETESETEDLKDEL